ncbi:carboxylesterase/lipase family protein [Novosphingobium aerophilum]|uniref:Carboxylic ester hydrolase n=1 Tax=Novosphingobium aerophilum TaxID=2839843 RepID=A0A7X1FAX3_9SPHN|nr:carboxylesterase family protein [Novosphingobium aerophilum]MBC2653581.1 carboxylesterase family protein [Novosphingobium aerophilum]
MASHRLTLLAAVAAMLLPSTHAVAAGPAGPATVRIDTGPVEGRTLSSGVTAYLGIPYAAPPVRELRWREPQPVQPWTDVFHADRFGPQCMQPQRNPLGNQYSGAEITSEDCLTLNVWTRSGLKRAPVIVYIHGGGFFIGASSMALYGGETVAREGGVFVNLNYRLGVLGFMAHPELSAETPDKTSGNYGFLDQIAALQWVKRNIARFGGDPDNVTIAGQSAGSMSVLALQASPLAKGLFHRAVGMSGATMGGPIGLGTLAAAEAEGVKLQAYLKAKSLADLRNVPADRLQLPRVPGGPTVGASVDGRVLTDQPEAVFARSAQNDVPLLLGFAKDESFGGIGAVAGLDDYRAKVATRFGDRAGEFLALYPAASDAEAKAQATAADRDATMALAMSAWATAQTRHGKAPVYSYEFARAHSYAPGVTFSDLDPATAGAYHTSEVPFWLGTLDSFNRYRHTRDWTPADRAFSRAMTRALVSFARTGKPISADMTWPTFDPAKPRLVLLGATMAEASWPDERKFAFFRSVARQPATGGALRD